MNNQNTAIDVVGPEVGLVRLSVLDPTGLNSLWDFKALIVIEVTKDQQAASWVLRARNKNDYYLFKLIFPTSLTNAAKLECFVYQSGKPRRVLPDESLTIDLYPFYEGDVLTISVLARENTFTNTIQLNNSSNPMNQSGNAGRSFPYTFTDNGYSKNDEFGSLGFRGDEPNYRMRVMQIRVYEVN
jgi:hypothetical protein